MLLILLKIFQRSIKRFCQMDLAAQTTYTTADSFCCFRAIPFNVDAQPLTWRKIERFIRHNCMAVKMGIYRRHA